MQRPRQWMRVLAFKRSTENDGWPTAITFKVKARTPYEALRTMQNAMEDRDRYDWESRLYYAEEA